MINCKASGSVCWDCKVFPGRAGQQGQSFRFHSLCCLSGKISTQSCCCLGIAALCLEGAAVTKDGVDWEQGWEELVLPPQKKPTEGLCMPQNLPLETPLGLSQGSVLPTGTFPTSASSSRACSKVGGPVLPEGFMEFLWLVWLLCCC